LRRKRPFPTGPISLITVSDAKIERWRFSEFVDVG
jgi:hypothetical protein